MAAGTIGQAQRALSGIRSQGRCAGVARPAAVLRRLPDERQTFSMPSRVADGLWHEFILHTREYQRFCRRAFGSFMHHTPATVLSENRKSNTGLRRVWWYCCKYENIDPRDPTRLPLLFALDTKLNIPNGFVDHHRCEALRAGGTALVYCGGDFSSSSFDGGTAGFGDGAGDYGGHGG